MPSVLPQAESSQAPEAAPRTRVVVFLLEEQRYAVRLSATERVVPAAALTPLPGAPDIVLGLFNLQGRIVPVFDIRSRFGLPAKPLVPDQQFLVVRTRRRTVAFPVDTTLGVLEVADDTRVPADAILPQLPYVQAVVRSPDGLVLIHDLDTFLELNEAETLEHALRTREGETCEQ